MHQLTPLFLSRKKLRKRLCSPNSMLLVCSPRSQPIAAEHCLEVGGEKDRQARKAKRDHSDKIGGQKGECVNNFVADCPKYNSSNGLKVQLRLESFILPCNLPCGYFRFILVDYRQQLGHDNDRWLWNFVVTWWSRWEGGKICAIWFSRGKSPMKVEHLSALHKSIEGWHKVQLWWGVVLVSPRFIGLWKE